MNVRAIICATAIAMSLGPMGLSMAADDLAVMPEVKTQNRVAYLSGGIGSDQVSAMQAAAKGYGLMLTCATRNTGEYLADVKVGITNTSGTAVLDTVTEGPILLVRLSPGQYRISADSNGNKVNRTVNVSANHPVKLNLYWPERPVKSSDAEPAL